MKKYEAPRLFVEEYVPDTMIASGGPKNGNAGNNQNCWGCRQTPGAADMSNPENACFYTPNENSEAYNKWCL